jgi:hypothetical protein
MNPATPEGAMPANVSESDRAMVTAGLANKSFKAKAERAELFVRIAQRLPASNRD